MKDADMNNDFIRKNMDENQGITTTSLQPNGTDQESDCDDEKDGNSDSIFDIFQK